ncbi:hypothetical protein [Floridanema fluviatile]|uniref:hypothetical protein n=1 Tax=Floridanema fluviatile TaxID=3396171 RepID=UPI0039A705BA
MIQFRIAFSQQRKLGSNAEIFPSIYPIAKIPYLILLDKVTEKYSFSIIPV